MMSSAIPRFRVLVADQMLVELCTILGHIPTFISTLLDLFIGGGLLNEVEKLEGPNENVMECFPPLHTSFVKSGEANGKAFLLSSSSMFLGIV